PKIVVLRCQNGIAWRYISASKCHEDVRPICLANCELVIDGHIEVAAAVIEVGKPTGEEIAAVGGTCCRTPEHAGFFDYQCRFCGSEESGEGRRKPTPRRTCDALPRPFGSK